MNCPCGSDREFEDCCGPLLAGAPAATAEALMRSRYTAYVRQDIDYLLATHDPETVAQVDREATDKWAREAHWLGLTVLGVERGGPDDAEGVVEFAARWRREGREYTHHERSRFRRHEGRWVYAEGHPPRVEPVRRTAPAVSPNAPCPCGSGRKYKRCHGGR